MESLTIALPKGRLQGPYDGDAPGNRLHAAAALWLDESSSLPTSLKGCGLSWSKPVDVPTYVEYGAADIGIVGLMCCAKVSAPSTNPPAGLSKCRLVLAGPPEMLTSNLRQMSNLRVATKYPNLALDYFYKLGISAEIITLNGSVELAPGVGLADLIVDLVETGITLRDNGLEEMDTLLESEAVLVVNRASHKMRFARVQELITSLAGEVERRKAEEQPDVS